MTASRLAYSGKFCADCNKDISIRCPNCMGLTGRNVKLSGAAEQEKSPRQRFSTRKEKADCPTCHGRGWIKDPNHVCFSRFSASSLPPKSTFLHLRKQYQPRKPQVSKGKTLQAKWSPSTAVDDVGPDKPASGAANPNSLSQRIVLLLSLVVLAILSILGYIPLWRFLRDL